MALNLGLFLGINRYKRINPDAPLRCAVRDAEAMAEMFRDKFGYETTVLRDDEVTFDLLRDTLEEWKLRFKDHYGGRLVIYFAGHGATTDDDEPILLTAGAAERDIANPRPGASVIGTRLLEEETADWPNVERAFILDACRTRANRRASQAGAGGRDLRRRESRLQATNDLAILRSCQPDQIAVELTNFGDEGQHHGIFTAALLQIGAHKASIESPFVIGPELHSELHQALRRLADFAPPDYRNDALAQTPVCDGAAILANMDDYRLLAVQRRDKQSFEEAERSGTLDAYRHALFSQSTNAPYRERLAKRIADFERGLDDDAWDEARLTDTLPAYRRYWRSYPKGRHSDQAQQRIKQLEAELDEKDWLEANSTATIGAYRHYLADHPEGSHATDAQAVLDRLQAEEDARDKEAADWRQALADDTEETYAHYLEQHPDGVNATAAREKHKAKIDERLKRDAAASEAERARLADEEDWRIATQADSEAGYAAYLDRQPEGHYRTDAQAKLDRKVSERLARDAQQLAEEQRAASEADNTAWRTACGEDSEDSYALYLAQQPRGQHRDKAEKRHRARKADNADWQTALKTDTETAYQRYLQQHPDGRHRSEAKVSLSTFRATQADRADWEQACKEDSEESYGRYLDRQGNGASRAVAEVKRRQIRVDHEAWRKADEAATWQAYADYLKKFSSGRHREEAQRALDRFKAAQLERIRQADEAAWQQALQEYSVPALRRYLTYYPQGSHVEAAHQCIAGIETQQADEAAWEQEVERHKLRTKRLKQVALPIGVALALVVVGFGLFADKSDDESLGLPVASSPARTVFFNTLTELVEALKSHPANLDKTILELDSKIFAALESPEVQDWNAIARYLESREIEAGCPLAYFRGLILETKLKQVDAARAAYTQSLSQQCSGKDPSYYPGEARKALARLGTGAVSGISPARTTFMPLSAFRDCPDCPEMVVIPGGEFRMGSLENEAGGNGDEGPVHAVKVKSFALGKYEVTQGEWAAVRGSNPSDFKACGPRCPVERVNWNDAQEFIRKLNEKLGLAGRADRYRLPSEAEWEYAARAGTTGPFSFEGPITVDKANYNGNSYAGSPKGQFRRKTVEVGSLPANPWGLHEVHGNVWEWVEDCWHGNYDRAPEDGSAWTTGCTDNDRVLRGGSWIIDSWVLRSAYRSRSTPDVRVGIFGFRLARTLPE